MQWIPAPFRLPAFRAYWSSRFASTIAQLAMVIVIGWQVYDISRRSMGITDASFRLGLIGLVQFVPLFLLTPVTGWAADHIDRRWVARASVALELFCAALLAWLTYTGSTSLPALFTVAALLGVARGFAGPAFGAMATNLVPREQLPRAIALSSIAWQVGAIAGPPLGGYLYAVSPAMPYFVSAALLSFSLLMLMLIPPLVRPETDGNQSFFATAAAGISYVRTNRLVLGAISLDLFAVLFGGATAMLPVYARDVLQTGPEGLGHLRAAPALGATLSAAYLAARPMKQNVGVKMLVAVALFGGMTVVFGISRSMPLSLASLAVLGAADMFSVNIRQSLINLHTPNEMRGRVGAVSSLFISASNELGEAESGFLAALIGPVIAVVAGGIGAVIVVALWAWKFPELRLADSFEPTDIQRSSSRTREQETAS